MPDDRDAQILQVLRREAGKKLFRNRVLAESGLVAQGQGSAASLPRP
jgi:hypothetical protein